MTWSLHCPACRAELACAGDGPADEVTCPQCRARWHRAPFLADGGGGARAAGGADRPAGGIWQLLRPQDRPAVERFLTDYTHIRRAEGRGSDDPAYYRNLPAVPADDALRWQWSMRATSWTHAEARLWPAGGPASRVIDVGAGVGWLAHRLARAGHDVAAVDLSLDPYDGLGAARHYQHRFTCVQAHFDHLPFGPGSADVVLFNASLHYSVDYRTTVAEALRVLRPEGVVAVLDSPIYRHDEAGRRMVAERHADFEARFGRRSDTVASRQYLTTDDLDRLADAFGLRWERSQPFYGWRWAARPWVARVRRRRPPSRFALLVGRR